MPQPVDLGQLDVSQSNLDDAELDLTVVDELSSVTAPATGEIATGNSLTNVSQTETTSTRQGT